MEELSRQQELGDYLIDFQFITSPVYFDDIRLYQVGKKFCSPTTLIPSHTHIDWFEFTVVLEGTGKIYVNRDSVPVSSGDVFLSFPCDIHKIESSPEQPLKYAFLSVCIENEEYKEAFNTIQNNFFECKKRIFRNPTLLTLIDNLINELTFNDWQQQKAISCILQQILILTNREFLHHYDKNIPKTINDKDILCYKIMRHIDSNLFSINNLTEVANGLNYNYSYLAKIFKQTTNITITQYFTNKKMERAKVLINEGALTLTKIAELLNYSSIYSFSKAFKLYFGLYPSEYKKQRQKTTHGDLSN